MANTKCGICDQNEVGLVRFASAVCRSYGILVCQSCQEFGGSKYANKMYQITTQYDKNIDRIKRTTCSREQRVIRLWKAEVLNIMKVTNPPRKPGVPTRLEIYKALKARSKELQENDP